MSENTPSSPRNSPSTNVSCETMSTDSKAILQLSTSVIKLPSTLSFNEQRVALFCTRSFVVPTTTIHNVSLLLGAISYMRFFGTKPYCTAYLSVSNYTLEGVG